MIPDPNPPDAQSDTQSKVAAAALKERAALVRIARLLGRQIAREQHASAREQVRPPRHIDKSAI